jgi:Ala-tRNA(Pro) deacylase
MILQAVRDLLTGNEIDFREVEHEPTLTSEESARARGEDLRLGGKALVIKTGDEFRLFVLSAALKADSSAIKARFRCKKIRFASAAELQQMTGLAPGSVPPFGKPILPFDLFVDRSILANERIAFNAGSLRHSIIINVSDYVRVAKPEIFDFSASL